MTRRKSRIRERTDRHLQAGAPIQFPERAKQGSAYTPSGFAKDGEPGLRAARTAKRNGFTAARHKTLCPVDRARSGQLN